MLLGRAIPLALAFVLVKIDSRWRWLAIGSLVIMLPTLLLTQSAGAIALGVPVGIAAVTLGRYRRRAIAPIVAVALIGLLGLALLAQNSAAVASLLDFSSGTNFVRLRLWESSLAILRDRPLTGLGLDQFLYYFGGEYLRPDALWDPDLSHPHNFILDFWTRLSIFGLAVFLLIQRLFWRRALAIMKRTRQSDPMAFAMTLGLAGSMAGLLAHGLVDNSVFVIDLAFIFMFQLAAMMRLDDLSS